MIYMTNIDLKRSLTRVSLKSLRAKFEGNVRKHQYQFSPNFDRREFCDTPISDLNPFKGCR